MSCRPTVHSTFGRCPGSSPQTCSARANRSLSAGRASSGPKTGAITMRERGSFWAKPSIERMSTAPEKLAQPAYASGCVSPSSSAP